MIEHFQKLMTYEIIDPAIWYTKVKKVYMEWERRFGDFEQYLEILAAVYLEELKGVDKDYMEFIAANVIEVNGDMVYKYSRDQIEWHKKKGHKVFFISGSPDFLVSKMAEKYGVTEYKGSLYEVDENNKFTGNIVPMWDSKSKQRVINKLIIKYNVDLKNSYAYGDTTGDLSMLRMMGNPIAINPNKPLLDALSKDPFLSQKTKVIVERKNVIYKLNPSVETIE
jgi:HAD superfamily hydrolase (TIGR01490 family)